MSINKSYKHSKSGNFTILSNELINDPNLSFKAKGIFLYFFSKPQGWDVRVDYTASIMQDGETAIYSGLKELETQGYLIRQRFYQNGRVAGMEYHFADDKDFTNITNINKEKLNLEKQGQVIINQEKPNDYIIKKTNNKEYNNKDNKEKNIKKENPILKNILIEIEKSDNTELTQDKHLPTKIEKVLNALQDAKIDLKSEFDIKYYILLLLCFRRKKILTKRALESDVKQLKLIPEGFLKNALESWCKSGWQAFKAEWVLKTQKPVFYQNKSTQQNTQPNIHDVLNKMRNEPQKTKELNTITDDNDDNFSF